MEEHLRVRGVEGANLSPTAGSPGLTLKKLLQSHPGARSRRGRLGLPAGLPTPGSEGKEGTGRLRLV